MSRQHRIYCHRSWFRFPFQCALLQVKERVKVEIGVEAVGGWGAVEGLDGGVLSLVEGEEREVVCEGREGYPAPSFLWDSHAPSISERRSEEERDGSDGVRKREGKEVAERSVDLDLFNGEEEEAIPLNTTTKVREKIYNVIVGI